MPGPATPSHNGERSPATAPGSAPGTATMPQRPPPCRELLHPHQRAAIGPQEAGRIRNSAPATGAAVPADGDLFAAPQLVRIALVETVLVHPRAAARALPPLLPPDGPHQGAVGVDAATSPCYVDHTDTSLREKGCVVFSGKAPSVVSALEGAFFASHGAAYASPSQREGGSKVVSSKSFCLVNDCETNGSFPGQIIRVGTQLADGMPLDHAHQFAARIIVKGRLAAIWFEG